MKTGGISPPTRVKPVWSTMCSEFHPDAMPSIGSDDVRMNMRDRPTHSGWVPVPHANAIVIELVGLDQSGQYQPIIG